ncbi:MAG TPA: hypothetical protein VMV44_07940 [Rectinemataceae bacterium]|nr:hypothetical protein [Rectinemataceae bacterium]
MTGRARRRAAIGVAPGDGGDRIAEFKEKLRDEAYLEGAIYRIATVLSARLMEGYADVRRRTR